MKITKPCKVCRQQVVIDIDPACPFGRREKLLLMLTCNMCFDIHESSEKAVRLMGNACRTIEQMRRDKNDGLAWKLKRVIETGLPTYFEWVARWHYPQPIIQQGDLADVIFEKPDKYGLALHFYKQTVDAEYIRRTDEVSRRGAQTEMQNL